MSSTTSQQIIRAAVPILAREGYAGTSIRKIASAIGREPSIIYVHFSDKASLLREVRNYINQELQVRQRYSLDANAGQLLRETLLFQFTCREMIVALLQYFMASPAAFEHDGGGYVPQRAYQHMVRVIEAGAEAGLYHSTDVAFDAKALTHLINGFLMEYYGRDMAEAELQAIVEQLAGLIERALSADMVRG